ncbi:hypothetical protein BV25DRAFT_1797647, partial [Artomyces pyxidatus]
LVRDGWPNAVARLWQDVKEYGDMSFYESVPSTFEDLCRWAYLFLRTRNHDVAKGFVFLYRPENPSVLPGNGAEVVIRFQGFIGQCNLKPLGNWKGHVSYPLRHVITEFHVCPIVRTPDTAHRAVHYLELKPGPFITEMEAQVSCVEKIRTFVFRELLSTEDAAVAERGNGEGKTDLLSFQRRVFTKVQNGSDTLPSVLDPLDDPDGVVASMHRFWRVTEKIGLGRKLSNGHVERCSHLVFGSGDFVDVTARIEIANVQTEHGVPTVKVFLSPVTVVQLCKAKNVQEVRAATRLHQFLANNGARGQMMGIPSLESSEETHLGTGNVIGPVSGIIFD